jgi:hypothetical protein
MRCEPSVSLFVLSPFLVSAALPWSPSCNPHARFTLMLFVLENQPSKDGKTPIESAKEEGHEGVVQMLLSAIAVCVPCLVVWLRFMTVRLDLCC